VTTEKRDDGFDLAAALPEWQAVVLRLHCDGTDRLRNAEEQFRVVQGRQVFDYFGITAAFDDVGVEQVNDDPAVDFVAGDGQAGGRGEARVDGDFVAQQTAEDFVEELPQGDRAVAGVDGEERMSERRRVVVNDSGGISGGFRAVRRMLVTAKVAGLPVEIGFVNVAEAFAFGDADVPVGSPDDERGFNEARTHRLRREEIGRGKRAGTVEFRAEIQPGGCGGAAGQQDFAAVCDEAAQFFRQCGLQVELFRQDQQFDAGELHVRMQEIKEKVPLLKNARRAGVGVAAVRDCAGVGGEHADVGEVDRVAAERFFLADFAVGMADQVVSGFVERAVGMELVADAAPGSGGQHGAALVTQRVGVLEAAEFAPGAVEFAGHAGEFEAGPAGERGRLRKVVVPPAAGRQALQLQVRKILEKFRPGGIDVAGVVEDRHLRVVFPHGFGDPFVIVGQHPLRELPAVRLRLRVEPGGPHVRDAFRADALALEDDVEKESVGVGEAFERLVGERAEVVEIGGVETELAEAGRPFVRRAPAVDAGRIDFAPFRVGEGGDVVAPGGEVDGDGDARLMRRVHLGAEQVERQLRMHDPDLRRVIAVTVVTDREAGDRIDRRIFQHPPEFGGIERGPHPGDFPRGVKVQVNLTITQ